MKCFHIFILSTAALPSNLRCSIEKNKINKNIANFVLPVGNLIIFISIENT